MQRLHTSQLPRPIGQLALELALLFHPIALPRGIVGVLHGERGQHFPLPGHLRCVERSDFAHQHVHRGSIGRDVVHAEGDERRISPGGVDGDSKHLARFECERFRDPVTRVSERFGETERVSFVAQRALGSHVLP